MSNAEETTIIHHHSHHHHRQQQHPLTLEEITIWGREKKGRAFIL